jgi:hypothetical protein
MTTDAEICAAARAFIAAAFAALREEHVIPTPIYHPYVAVGRDYFGDTVRGAAGYAELERVLDETYPERFAEPLKRRHAEFASSYIFSFLEAAIARCARQEWSGNFDPDSTASTRQSTSCWPYSPRRLTRSPAAGMYRT